MPVDVASGRLHDEYQDLSIPGSIPLQWVREYSSGTLRTVPTALGLGWTTQYFAALRINDGRFELTTPYGDIEVFAAPGGIVAQGGRIRHFSTFKELFAADGRFVVQIWDVESGSVRRLVFQPRPRSAICLLSAIEDVSGRGL